MKNKLIGLALMAVGLVVGLNLALYIFFTKGLFVLFGCVIPWVAGKIIYGEATHEDGSKASLWGDIKTAVSFVREKVTGFFRKLGNLFEETES